MSYYDSPSRWEKHNVLQFIEKNYCKDVFDLELGYLNSEFTEKMIFKKVKKEIVYCSFFGERVISEHLSSLVKDGIISVRYISEKATPEYYYWNTKNKNNSGWKTVPIYKLK